MTKEMSKRQQRREKMRRESQRRRLLTIGLVTLGAVLLAFFFIYPNLRPVGDVITVEPNERPQADGVAMGDPNAPVRIDVFEDFQCPACRSYSLETAGQITDTYVETGQVYYVFHNYAFLDTNTVTKESQQAANASMCAAEQNRFWEYHDVLFANWNGENLGAFNDRRLLAFAETIDGLEMDAFTTCFNENRFKDEIDADFDLGGQMGVTGTPSIFVNGEIVDPGYVPQFADLQPVIEAALGSQ